MLFIQHVYMFSCISNTALQSPFFLHKRKLELNKCVKNFIQKFCDIIKAPQKHSYTMGKYISDDVFVSMTASRSSQS